jgi:ribosomal protein S18 acetylase RimI-like enzyme
MKETYCIREAAVGDCSGIARVIVDTWRAAYRGNIAQDFLDRLSIAERQDHLENFLGRTDEETFAFVGVDETGGVVGYAGAGLEGEPSTHRHGELYALYVLEEHQRKGIGCRLVGAVAGRFRAMKVSSLVIWVLAGNPCTGFYGRLGGWKIDTRKLDIGGVSYDILSYGWSNLERLAKLV